MNSTVGTAFFILVAAFGVTLVIYDFDFQLALAAMFSEALVGAVVVAYLFSGAWRW